MHIGGGGSRGVHVMSFTSARGVTCERTRQGSGGSGQGKRDKILYGDNDIDTLGGRAGKVARVLVLSRRG